MFPLLPHCGFGPESYHLTGKTNILLRLLISREVLYVQHPSSAFYPGKLQLAHSVVSLVSLYGWKYMGELMGFKGWSWLVLNYTHCWRKVLSRKQKQPKKRRNEARQLPAQQAPKSTVEVCVEKQQTNHTSKWGPVFWYLSYPHKWPQRAQKMQQMTTGGTQRPGSLLRETNCSQHQEVPFPSFLPCWSWAALAQPCPSQVDASSNANSGYFYYCNLNSLLSLRK